MRPRRGHPWMRCPLWLSKVALFFVSLRFRRRAVFLVRTLDWDSVDCRSANHDYFLSLPLVGSGGVEHPPLRQPSVGQLLSVQDIFLTSSHEFKTVDTELSTILKPSRKPQPHVGARGLRSVFFGVIVPIAFRRGSQYKRCNFCDPLRKTDVRRRRIRRPWRQR
jgi:hypothetical protein